ncbi:MAG: hypothetical protein MRY63_03940 [Neomegalonema sp.]|nr:hypothetical protein [Neomegalonema sp.]
MLDIILVAQSAADAAAMGMSQEDFIYNFITLFFYSGGGVWLIGRLSRGADDRRVASRKLITDNLTLMERMGRVREQIPDTARKNEIDEMWNRLLSETAARITDLNTDEEKENSDPASRYLILPPPRTVFGALASVLFIGCLYVAIGALLLVAMYFFRGEVNIFDNEGDLQWFLKVMILAGSLSLVALLLRYLAFLSFRRYMARKLEGEAERLAAIREVAARQEPTF